MISLGENSKQEVERQIQEAASENRSADHVEEDPSKSRDGSSEKGPKKTEETPQIAIDSEGDKAKTEITASEAPRQTGIGSEANKAKTETTASEVPRIAETLTDEPEAQEQTKTPGRADEASGSLANPRTAPAAPEAQVPRPTPLYWRRLTARYMSVGPQPS